MTDQPQFTTVQNSEAVHAGDLVYTWCSRHKRTYRRYDPGGKCKLVCLECERERSEVTK